VIIDIGLSLFQIIMGLAALFSLNKLRSAKAAGCAKGLPTPPFILSQALLGVIFVSQLAHYIIRRPTDGINTAAAVMLSITAVFNFLSLSWNYGKLYRRFLSPEASRDS
jgi:hypothetical protein